MPIINKSNLTSQIELPDGSTEQVETESNESSTENMTVAFIKEKESAKTFAKPNEEVVQTITLTNNSEYPIDDVTIVDTISTGATFKAGSVKIDGVDDPTADITIGLTLQDSIEASDTIMIEYTMIIDSSPTVTEVTNTAQVTYSVNEVTDLVENTNTVTIELVNNIINIEKTSSASAVITGQTLTFINVVKNEGTTKNTNLFFIDPIPEGTTFVTGSVKIDDVAQASYDPATGFALPDLDVGEQVTVKFDVTIN